MNPFTGPVILTGDTLTRSYESFVAGKLRRHRQSGVSVSDDAMHPSLFGFQRAVTQWALRKGRACIFAGTGLGKTRMQLEFVKHIPGKRLIVAPLAVSGQTIDEASGMGLYVDRADRGVRDDGIYIVNYDRLPQIHGHFDAVVLDESGIIKSHDGSYRKYLTERFEATPFRLACTATPAPNDYMELGSHAEFIGASSRSEMLATYFMHDGGDTSVWRLKRHARADFWRWVASWAMTFSHPSDLGFQQSGYDLPDLIMHDHRVDSVASVGGGLFGDGPINATQVFRSLNATAPERVQAVVQLIDANPSVPWLIWCNTNAEQALIRQSVSGVVSVDGSDAPEAKEDRLLGFARGQYDRLVTKPKIAGFGMNWQRCSHMIFCGVTYSFEQLYQAIRRCWRFGQTNPVHVHLVTCNAHECIQSAVQLKQLAFASMGAEMAGYCQEELSRL